MEPEERIRDTDHHRSPKTSGPFSDLVNVLFFLLMLALLLAMLAVLDPLVKRVFSRFLP